MSQPSMKTRPQKNSLAGQVVAVNVLLVVATLFAATAAASMNLELRDDRFSFVLLAMTIILVLLVNMMMLRRRFHPLEQLIERVEAIDPAQPSDFEPPTARGAACDSAWRRSRMAVSA